MSWIVLACVLVNTDFVKCITLFFDIFLSKDLLTGYCNMGYNLCCYAVGQCFCLLDLAKCPDLPILSLLGNFICTAFILLTSLNTRLTILPTISGYADYLHLLLEFSLPSKEHFL